MTTQAGAAEREDLIPNFESPNVLPDGFNFPGQLAPENRLPWFRDSKRQTCHGAKAGRHVETSYPPVSGRYRRRVDSYPDFISLGCRCFHFLQSNDLGWSVSFIQDRKSTRLNSSH